MISDTVQNFANPENNILNEKVGVVTQDSLVEFLEDLIENFMTSEIELDKLDLPLQHLSDQFSEFGETFVDVIWTFSMSLENNQEKEKQLIEFCNHIKNLNIVQPRLWKLSLEPEFLQKLELVKDSQAMTKKQIRMNTTLVYKQTKFNLLRECTEGYSKIITFLSIAAESRLKIEKVESNILSLLGGFLLEPIVIIDLIIDCFASNVYTHSEYFLEIFKRCTIMMDYKTKEIDYTNISHLIGFKLDFFSKNSKKIPTEYYVVTALLIEHEICKLKIIYSYLTPLKSDYKDTFDHYYLVIKDKAESVNFNNMSISPMSKEENSENDKPNKTLDEPLNNENLESESEPQKPELLSALLYVGDYKNASIIINEEKRFIPMSKNSPIYLSNLANAMIENFYKTNFPENFHIPHEEKESKYKIDNFLRFTQSKGAITKEMEYKGLEYIENEDGFYNNFFVLLKELSPYVTAHPILFSRMCRIGKTELKKKPNNSEIRYNWKNFIKEVMIPSLSLSDPNPDLVEELWQLMQIFTLNERYEMYDFWKFETYDRCPELKCARIKSTKITMSLMRRVTKENTEEMSMSFGREILNNPTVVYKTIINQMMGFHNMINPVVESLAHLTEMGLEILIFCCVETLTEANAPRIKEDGINEADWLKGISKFIATLCRKYHNANLFPILNYVVNRLHENSHYDLIILRDLMNLMAGIEGYETATLSQLEAISAKGPLKKEEFMNVSQIKYSSESVANLVKSITDASFLCVLPLLIYHQKLNLQKSWEKIVSEKEFNEKLANEIAYWLDQCQEIFVLLCELLSENVSTELYREMIPTIKSLHLNGGLPLEISFHVFRPKMKTIQSEQTEVDLNKKPKKARSNSFDLKNILNDTSDFPQSSRHTFEVKDIVLSIKEFFDLKVGISAEFFTTFWSFELYDIWVPMEIYKKQIYILEEQLNKSKSSNKRISSKEATYNKQSGKLDIKINDYKKRMDMIENQQRKHMSEYYLSLKRIKSENTQWFSSEIQQSKLIDSFIDCCVNPRIRMSAIDATFCARFVKMIHTVGTFNFSTLAFYDKIMDTVHEVISTSTETQIRYYGRFLSETLYIISAWHSDKRLYNEEARGRNLPGFQKKWTQQNTDRTLNDEEILQFEDYRHLVYKWHLKLHKAFVNSLESSSLTVTRNSIVLLTYLEDKFPKVDKIGNSIEKSISKLLTEGKFEELKVLTISYLAILNKCRNNWIPMEKFHLKIPNSQDIEVEKQKSSKDTRRSSPSLKKEQNTQRSSERYNDNNSYRRSTETRAFSETKNSKSHDAQKPTTLDSKSQRKDENEEQNMSFEMQKRKKDDRFVCYAPKKRQEVSRYKESPKRSHSQKYDDEKRNTKFSKRE